MATPKSAASFARERLREKDVTPKERLKLLQIISADDKQKRLDKRAKLAASVAVGGRRYTKKTKSVQTVEPTKTNNRNLNKETAFHTKDRPFAEVIAEYTAEEKAEPVVEPAPVVEPVVEPVKAPATKSGHFIY